jgi:predicted RNA methylase
MLSGTGAFACGVAVAGALLLLEQDVAADSAAINTNNSNRFMSVNWWGYKIN